MDNTQQGAPLLTDRTTTETDWTCGMRRWWYKHEGDRGIVPAKEAHYFQVGRDIHQDFLGLARSGDPVEFARAATLQITADIGATDDQVLQERLCRQAGWLVAAALWIEPQTRELYDTIFLEHELVLDRSPLWFAVTPDRVLRRKRDKAIVVRDYKSVGGWGATKQWVDYWTYATQLQTLLFAVAEELGEPVAFAQVMGLVKGQERAGKLRHPYVWAYSDAERHYWTTDGQEARRKALTLTPVWEYPGGIFEWVDRLGPEVAAVQFPFANPVFPRQRQLDDLIESRTFREGQVRAAVEQARTSWPIRLAFFPPNYQECLPVIGAPCPYLACCHNASVQQDPVGSGQFVPRQPHHELELTIGEENEEEE